MKDVILLLVGVVSGVLIWEAFGAKVKAFVAHLFQVVRAWRESLGKKIAGK